jgi:hypothetical protein
MVALVLLNLAWRAVRYGFNWPLWGDEAFVAVNFLTRGFGELGGALDHDQAVPIGFLWALRAVTLGLGTSEWALRLLPFVAGVASVVVLWRLAVRLVDRHAAMVAVAIMAASYYPVRHGNEVKPYSVDMLASVVLMWLAWRVWERPTAGRWGALAAAGALAVWVSYPSVFVAGGLLAVLGAGTLLNGRGVAEGADHSLHSGSALGLVAAWGMTAAAVAGSFVAMFLLFGRQQVAETAYFAELEGWARAFPPLTDPVGLGVWFIRAHTGNLFAYPVGAHDGGSTLTFLLFVAGAIGLWRSGRGMVAAMMMSPFVLMFIAAAMERYPYGDSARIGQHVAPAICLLAGVGVVTVLQWLGGRIGRRRLAVHGCRAACVLMVVVIVIGAARDVARPHKHSSDRLARDAARWLASATTRGDVWFVYGALGSDAEGPDWRLQGGAAARMRYYVLRQAPGEVVWGVPPEAVTLPPTGDGWLLVYDHFRSADPPERRDAYVATVVERLGPPEEFVFELYPGRERLTVYRFTGE